MGLESLEARIVIHQKNEAVYEEDIAFLKYDVQVKDISIKDLKNQLVEALREKDDLKLKLEKFETSSMKLTKLINSQISVNNKSGVGFDSQVNENELHDCHLNKGEVFESASDSSVNEIEEENNQVNDRFKKVEGYHAVPPPYIGNYMPSRPDLSFAGLDDSVYKTNVSETITSVPRNESTASKSSKDSLEQPKDVRPSAPIIEEWESDSDDDYVTRPSIEQNKPSYAKINFVKSDKNTRKSIIEQNTCRQPENLRKSQSPRIDKRNWNGLMTQKLGDGFEFNKKACFVCGSLNHLIKDCNFYENKMVGKSVLNNMGSVIGQREVRPVWNNAQRVNHQNKLTHPHPKRNFVPTAVATKSGLVPVNAAKQSSPRAATSISTARQVNTAASKPKVNVASPIKYSYFKAHSPLRRPFNQKSAAKTNNFNKKVYTAKVNNVTTAGPEVVVSTAEGKRENAVKSSACWIWRPTGKVIDHISKDSGSYMPKRFDYGNPQYALQDQGIFDSGCSRHMTGNKSYLTDYQDIDGGFVAFAGSPKGGKITGKGKIRTGKLDFEDVYFVKELKFNLFSVSQMCDKKNSVLFTETECLVLSPDFKLLDESQVLLKVPRQNNMYSFDLKNVVPSGGLTCLIAKATIDESNLWHRRLGHINFKTMNKLVRGNLVRGLPSKIFENDHSCVACQKGKQHKASCKTKLVSSISHPLQMLHMDLFGPTFVRSINHKIYCLVVTDDYSRFSWVFFLATKDETSGILKTFITGIENQINHKVKIIRCDNGTEFKNNDMNQFCGMKGIKREFSVTRTPQQNEVAERKNRTLIEAARTMLADSLLPTTFWAEAVSTACYVHNRVLVTKPHNKTPYELLHGRPPSISFMRPFGCPVTILNTLDPLGKFDEKADEGFFVGYSINSKAFRIFNTRTRKVEENLHINFLENKPNVAGSGPDWLFDIDSLTKSMNYEPVTAGNQTNDDAGIETNVNAGQARQKKASDHEYILLPLMLSNSPLSSSSKSTDDKDTDEVPDKGDNDESQSNGQEKEGGASNKEDDQHVQDFRAELNNLLIQQKEGYANSTNRDSTASPSVSTAGLSINTASENINIGSPNINTASPIPNDSSMQSLENTGIFDDAYDDREVGVEADLNNLETTMNVSPIPTTRIHKDHPKDQIIGDINLATQTRRMIKISKEHAMKGDSSLDRSKLDRSNARGASAIQTSKCLDSGGSSYWQEGHWNKMERQSDILLVQVYVDDIIFGSTKKSLCLEFERIMHKRFHMSSIGELTFFLGLQTASTHMEPNKALVKNEEAKNVDVHLYRSMIRSLMYLTTSRPDITFVVCACARFQVTLKVSHLHAVKRIFRYLKGQPKLGLWYPRDSSFDLEAFSDSDYAGASLDRKSTTGGCQFLGKRLISWQCKKQTIVANSTTEAEYVAAANCCGQVLWIQNQMLDYGFNFMNTKIHIDNESTICIVKNPVFHSKTKHIEIRHHFIRDSYEKKLIQVIKIHTDHNVAELITKAFDVNETVYKEWEDRMERAATTASSLEVEQDNGNINRTQSMGTLNEPSP
ncbi:putative ribonuclease H-like domain-containing protein [Tanacetum coccineum]